MASYLTIYRCPDCGEKFKWPRDIDPPRRCVHCDSWMEVDEPPPEFIPKAPMIRNGERVRAVEDVYYAMEDGSRARAEMAAQHLPGVSASELTHMHITDMNDRQKAGDIAAKPVNNTISQAMSRGIGGWQGMGAAEFASAAHGGPRPDGKPALNFVPHAGEAARQQTTQIHSRIAAPMVRASEIGRYMPPKAAS